jgi:hypothetical protein
VLFCSATFFCARETALQFLLIGHKKTSFITGTLGDIWAKFLEIKIYYIEIIMNM